MSMKGKVALVTGGSAGLGAAMASLFLTKGANLALLDVNKNALDVACREMTRRHGADRVYGVPCDVRRGDEFADAVTRAGRRWGRLDVFVNNAGIAGENAWRTTVDINVNGVIQGTLLAVDHMGKHRGGNGGVVINVSSLAGIRPNPEMPIYVATKFAVVGFTQAMGSHHQLAYHGVRVNAICPSFAQTAILTSGDGTLYPEALKVDPDDWYKSVGGVMSPDYVAKGVAMLVEGDEYNGAIMRITPKRGYEVLDQRALAVTRGRFSSKM